MKTLVLHCSHEAAVQNPHSWLSSCGVTALGSKTSFLLVHSNRRHQKRHQSRLRVMQTQRNWRFALKPSVPFLIRPAKWWDWGTVQDTSSISSVTENMIVNSDNAQMPQIGKNKSCKHVRYAAVSPSSARRCGTHGWREIIHPGMNDIRLASAHCCSARLTSWYPAWWKHI